jgi:hypothetical protein
VENFASAHKPIPITAGIWVCDDPIASQVYIRLVNTRVSCPRTVIKTSTHCRGVGDSACDPKKSSISSCPLNPQVSRVRQDSHAPLAHHTDPNSAIFLLSGTDGFARDIRHHDPNQPKIKMPLKPKGPKGERRPGPDPRKALTEVKGPVCGASQTLDFSITGRLLLV